MNHLAEAKEYAQCANRVDGEMFAQLNAQLAIAHALIALVERMDKTAEDAELETERLERWQEYQARRKMGAAL